MICKINPKKPSPNCFKDIAKNSEAWREDNLPNSHVKVFMHARTTRHRSHTSVKLKGTNSVQLPYRRGRQPVMGSLQKGLNRGCNWISGWNAFTPLTFSVFNSTRKAVYSHSLVLALWPSLYRLKNSLIKVQTVAIFLLLKRLKSSLCYVANYKTSLIDKYPIHKTFCLLVASPPLALTNRIYPTDTSLTKQGRFSPLLFTVLSFCLACLFQGTVAAHL